MSHHSEPTQAPPPGHWQQGQGQQAQWPQGPQGPQGQWQPPPPPPGPPPGPKPAVWIAVAGGVLVLLLGVFAVTAFAAPGFLVDDDSEDSPSESSDEPRSREEDKGGPGGQPDVPIPPPNASAPEPGEVPPPSLPDEPDAPDVPEAAPAGDAEGFATEYLGLVAAGDAAGVDERMCGADEEWQYEDAVGEGRQLTLSEPRADATAPGGFMADLTGPEGTIDGRMTVLPDAGGWCVDTFYVF